MIIWGLDESGSMDDRRYFINAEKYFRLKAIPWKWKQEAQVGFETVIRYKGKTGEEWELWVKDLSAQISRLESRDRALVAENDALRRQAGALEQERAQAERHADKFCAEAAYLQQENDRLEARVKDLDATLKRYTDKLSAQASLIAGYERQADHYAAALRQPLFRPTQAQETFFRPTAAQRQAPRCTGSCCARRKF